MTIVSEKGFFQEPQADLFFINEQRAGRQNQIEELKKLTADS